ncbi:pectinesterase family protein [Parachryseolinea silvisoli]|uniref:pectinesterase family protein n=1 Tax=Parachryseolinea silvisoli TaxID=2873601 RepID=UPI002265BF6B|nr:pectinesterase family protein [Parachryseolinea silvisoli]
MLFRNTMLTAGMRKLVLVFGMLIAVLLLHAQQQVVSVAQDGTGNFRTIQEAVNASANHSQTRIVILVKKGTYNEKLVIPSWKTNIMLKGEDKEHTIIIWNDYSGKGEINTFTSYTVLVQGNDFRAENITFENSAGTGVGQAVALHVEADRCVFVNCKIVANQDTLYAGVDNSRQYYQNCYIEGTTDFIFGSATVVFDGCHIHGKKNSYITAASTPQRQRFGFVFRNCTITTSPETTKLYLGRPWRPYAKTVFIECNLSASILPEGWHNWSKPDAEGTSFYAEYKSTGAGASPTTRAPWSHQLTAAEVNVYTLENIFGDWKAAALD